MAVSACGAAPAVVPTTDPANVQNTAIAAAFTVVAQTQAALPTATPTTPPTATPTETQTPAPTNTPVVAVTETLETSPTVVATLPPATSGGSDPCNKPLTTISGGKPAKIKVQNNSGAPVTFSLYLNKTAFGDCGYRGYVLIKDGSTLITDLIQGCYNVSVFVNDPKKPTKSFGYGCINNPDKWTFFISRESVILQGR